MLVTQSCDKDKVECGNWIGWKCIAVVKRRVVLSETSCGQHFCTMNNRCSSDVREAVPFTRFAQTQRGACVRSTKIQAAVIFEYISSAVVL